MERRAELPAHLLQVGAVDRWLGELLEHLNDTGLHDRSLLVLTADHGVSFRPGDHARYATRTTFQDVLPVPLFIKAPFQQQGQSARAGGPQWTTRRRPAIVHAGWKPVHPENPLLVFVLAWKFPAASALVDSRLRGNDGYGLRGNAVPSSHSRLRGNDDIDAGVVIPAKAGIHVP